MDQDSTSPESEVRKLEGNAVHLWWMWAGEGEEPGPEREWLSAAESRRSEAFRSDQDRRAFELRRGFLRALLASYTGRDPAELVLEEDEFGKPHLPSTSLSFNVSHSGDAILVALADAREVGADVERHGHEEWLDGLAAHFFDPTEREELESTEPDRLTETFFRGWARKEALLKALGVGFLSDPRRFFVGLGEAPPGRVWAPADPLVGGFGAVADLETPPGYAAAVAAAGCGWHPEVRGRFRGWSEALRALRAA